MGYGKVELNIHIGPSSTKKTQEKKMKYAKNSSGLYGRFGAEVISGVMALIIFGSSTSVIMHPMSFFTTDGTHIPKIELSSKNEDIKSHFDNIPKNINSPSDADIQKDKDLDAIRQLIVKQQQEDNHKDEKEANHLADISHITDIITDRIKPIDPTDPSENERIARKIKSLAKNIENSETQLNKNDNSPDEIQAILKKISNESSNAK